MNCTCLTFWTTFTLIQILFTTIIVAEELRIDCYFHSFINSNNSGDTYNRSDDSICKSGYFRLPETFQDEQFLDNQDKRLSKHLLLGVFCCPKGKGNDERGGAKTPFFWPNELKGGKLTRAFMTCHASSIPGLDTIRFLLYTKKTLGLFDFEELLVNDLHSLQHSNFIKGAPVKVIIHGFMSSAFVGPAPTLRAAYAKVPEKFNIIAVHWEALANLVTASDGICYDIASQSTKHVGRKTAEMIEFLIKSNYTTLEKVHVMGHSLGSHCAGFTGKFIRIGKLPRITAFDPARPVFVDRPPAERLDYTDAEFIDVIHTATKQWKLLGALSFGFLPFPVGIKAPMGHSDFYPNYGTHQPGCVLQLQKLPALCSHSRSYFYYAESIRYHNQRVFLSNECDTLDNLEKGICPKTLENTKVIMGEYTPVQNISRKLYYVKTNARTPFAVTVITTDL
ncbi:putative endothelial lipase [Folsomia candida]|uniref:putative endothelial lipase n=1 Tax=Folsomia candida TaxID=158441 RepID=UPI00160540A1|nr:putative endothelial lipase [Folsomia candida]